MLCWLVGNSQRLPLPALPPPPYGQPYTEYISTRWYRAPECLLTDGYYGYKMDMWGVGCVMFEVLALYPLFPGTDEVDQIKKIHKIMGTPPPAVRQHRHPLVLSWYGQGTRTHSSIPLSLSFRCWPSSSAMPMWTSTSQSSLERASRPCSHTSAVMPLTLSRSC